jgi:hypothetical protein
MSQYMNTQKVGMFAGKNRTLWSRNININNKIMRIYRKTGNKQTNKQTNNESNQPITYPVKRPVQDAKRPPNPGFFFGREPAII